MLNIGPCPDKPDFFNPPNKEGVYLCVHVIFNKYLPRRTEIRSLFNDGNKHIVCADQVMC